MTFDYKYDLTTNSLAIKLRSIKLLTNVHKQKQIDTNITTSESRLRQVY
jgi:hypothetical protein